jgi:hypothetical protein
MLITTVATVSVIQAGMKVAPMLLVKSAGPQVRSANPTMVMDISVRRLAEDFPCRISSR